MPVFGVVRRHLDWDELRGTEKFVVRRKAY